MDKKTLWITRLTWLAIGLCIAGLLTGVIYLGDRYDVWDRLWVWSGLWRWIHFSEETIPFVQSENYSYATLNTADTEIVGALVNPGFEGTYLPQDGQGPLQLAPGWKAQWVEGMMGKPGIGVAGGGADTYPFRRPEWKRATLEFPYRVRSGESAQQWFSYSGIHYGGIYQVATVKADDTVAFTVYGQGWAGSSNDPLTNGDIYVSLGIDPECKIWLESRSVIWTAWMWLPNAKSQNASLDNWTLFKSNSVKMQKDCATIWIVTTAKWPTQHDDVYFDDAKMWRVAQGTIPCPTPTPVLTPTPCVCPTPVPCPTPGAGGTCTCTCVIH